MMQYISIIHYQKFKKMSPYNITDKDIKNNLFNKLKEAESRNDKKVVDIILHLFDEIEKLILLKEIHKNRELLKIYSNDVLNVIAFADNFQTARTKIYKLIDNIDWQEGFCRRDIASSSLKN